MAKLDSTRRSYVRTTLDWPRGTRTRGFGILCDEVWMPIPKAEAHWIKDREQVEIFNGEWHRLYLGRKMLWHPLGTFRIHTFYMGDDDGAPHDHPWWFVTFPLRTYTETVQTIGLRGREVLNSRMVRAFRFHFRRATHRHFVHEPYRKVTTLVMTGRVCNDWSFYPEGRRVPHKEWTNYNREAET